MNILILLLFSSLTACSYLPGPIAPMTAAAGGAVLLEDLLEDPACDAEQTSIIEAVADILNWPLTFLWQIIAFEGSVWWGVGSALTGQSPSFESKFNQIMDWLPIRYAGVPSSLHEMKHKDRSACIVGHHGK